MNPKVSIIVPMYDVEKYVRHCIDSLINQTLTDIEIILVNDGSPDNCGEIADFYSKKDKRIKVIHQQNNGLGPARNSGMKVATGDYIGFVDSDDWARPEMFERLYNSAEKENADIVVSGHCDLKNGKVMKIKKHPFAGTVIRTSQEIMEIRKNLFGHSINEKDLEAFPMSVCISVYRKEMIDKNNLQFLEILSEDTIFNLYAYKCANTIAFIGNTDYCYRKEEQPSITQSFSENKLLRYQMFLMELADVARQENDVMCELRAKRKAIDYCRLYVGIVDNSNESFLNKMKHIRSFASNKEIKECWEGYPVKTLPIQQKLFHVMIETKCYGVALFMNGARQRIKEGKW